MEKKNTKFEVGEVNKALHEDVVSVDDQGGIIAAAKKAKKG